MKKGKELLGWGKMSKRLELIWPNEDKVLLGLDEER